MLTKIGFALADASHHLLRFLVGLTGAIILVVFFVINSRYHQEHFFDQTGKRMKEVKTDARFRKFSHGYHVSEEGQKVAQSDPYIIRNRRIREVVISTPEHMKEFFHSDAKDHIKPPAMNLGHYFDRLLGQSVGVQSGAKWRTTRAHFNPSFSYIAATNCIPIFEAELGKWMGLLSTDSSASTLGANGFSIDAVDACRLLPFKLIALACYGDMLTDEVWQELLSLNSTHETLMSQAVFGRNTTSKLYGVFPTKHKQRMDEYQKKWEDFNMSIVRRAQSLEVRCPVAAIYGGVHTGEMTQAEYLQTIDEILFTNIDVTSAVLAFLLINLAANTSIQEELRREVLDRTAAPGESGDESVKPYITSDNTILEYACRESVRLCPAAWFSLPEVPTSSKRISGFLVPTGTSFIIDWKRLNTTSPIWNPPSAAYDGLTFNPARFKSLTPSQYRYSLLRFGIGPRKCIGKNFAVIIQKLVLITVLKSYKLTMDQGDVEIRSDRFTVTPRQGVTFEKIETTA